MHFLISHVSVFFPPTYMYFYSAGLWADVGAGKCEWLPTHLAKAPHKGMVWDTYAYQLRDTWTWKQQMADINLSIIFEIYFLWNISQLKKVNLLK